MKETSIVFCTDKALEPPEPECYCERCRAGISKYEAETYRGHLICGECKKYMDSSRRIVDYISAYPDNFAAYLAEYHDDIKTFSVEEMLTDFDFYENGDIEEWAIR